MSRARTFGNAALVVLFGAAAAGAGSGAVQESGRRKSDAPGAGAAAKAEGPDSLLTNGGVEDGRDTPAGWEIGARIEGVQYSWDKKVAHSGKASLRMKKTAPRFFPIAQWFQEVRLTTAPARLKVGAWVKAEKAAKATLDIVFLDDAGRMKSHKWAAYIGAKEANGPPVTHDWKWYEQEVDLPAGTKRLLVAPQIYGPGTVWFDDLVVSAAEGTAKNPPKRF